jgi:putative oxidoreductase
MAIIPNFSAKTAQRFHAVLRMVTAYLFILHGSAKILQMPHVARFDHIHLFSLAGFAGLLELVGGGLLLVGLFTRPTAFILSGEMAFAYFIGHATQTTILLPILNHGDAAILYCFIFLFLSAAGSGTWSIDAMLSRR